MSINPVVTGNTSPVVSNPCFKKKETRLVSVRKYPDFEERRYEVEASTGKKWGVGVASFFVSLILHIARVIDVILINILINTKLNMHYGFIPDEIYIEAVVARTAKNVLELIVDIPLLFIILPITLAAYKRLSK